MRIRSIAKSIALLFALLLTLSVLGGCSDAALTVGEQEVSPDLLRYFTLNYRNDLGYTDQEYAADPAKGKELEKLVHEALKEVMTYRALAEKYDLELSEEEEAYIQTSLEDLKASYADDEEYQKALKEGNLTEEVYKELTELQILAQKVYDYLTSPMQNIIVSDDAAVDADLAAGNFFSAEYLYIYYTEGDKAEKIAFADTLYQALQSGSTMRALDDQYATQYGLSMEFVELGAFTYTQQEEAFEQLILSLKEGECAAPVVRGDGILIARRCKLSMDYVKENYSEVVDSYKEREFAYYIREYGKDLEISYRGEYEDMHLWEIQ